MNWTVEYNKNQNFVKVATEGIFTIDDHVKMVEDILSREYWQPGMNILFDHRKLSMGKSSFEDMKKAGGIHVKNDERIGNGRAAILMKSVSDFGVGRQFEMLTDEKISANIHIFLDEKQALMWLGA